MAEAEPALAAAAEALKNIKRDDIAELKQFANPAESVKNVCICVLNMRPTGEEEVDGGWKGAQKMMGNSQFLFSLLKYYFTMYDTNNEVNTLPKILCD